MTTEDKTPSPAEALSAYRHNVATAREAATAAIGEVNTSHEKTLAELAAEKATKISTAEAEKNTAIAASQQTVDEKAKIAEAARKAYEAAQQDLAQVSTAHVKTTTTVTQVFNQVSAKANDDTADLQDTAEQQRRAAVKAEKQKVKDKKRQGRHDVVEEVLALKDHKIHETKKTTAKIGLGFANFARSIVSSFNQGYAQDPGIPLPARLAKRRQAAQPAEAANDTEAAPQVATAPKAEGPAQP